MKAVIMAGGKGTRLRPLTCDRPKPMVPIANRPMMEHIVSLLARSGFQDVAVTMFYLPEAIQEYFGDGYDWQVNLSYFIEEVPLGTAGSVKNAAAFLNETFLVISGDALTDFDLQAALRFHREKGALATLVLTKVETPLEYGVVITDGDGRIRQFLEKPSWGEVFSDTVNTGIYVLEPEIFDDIPPGEEFDFSKNLFPLLLEKGAPLYGYVAPGYWSDIGNLEQYRQAHYDLLAGKINLPLPGEEIEPGIRVEEGALLHPEAKLQAPVLIGQYCRVGPGAYVEGSVLGSNCVLMPTGSIKRSILWDNAYLGQRVEVRGAILGDHVRLKDRAAIFEGAVVGDNCSIGQGATIRPNTKLWPGKSVDSGVTVADNLVWGSRWSRSIFGSNGVSGLVNVELTAELASKLGAALGSTLPPKAQAVVGADNYRPSRMLKRALIAGLLSAGVDVFDLGSVTTPVARHAVVAGGAKAGVHVHLAASDPRIAVFKFFDERGLTFDKGRERKVENAFFCEDFRRAAAEEIGTLAFLPRIIEHYVDEVMELLDSEGIRQKRFRIVVDYDAATLSLLLPLFLERLGCIPCVMEEDEQPRDDWRRAQGFLANVQRLAERVVQEGADLGLAVDNSGERLVLVDEQGNILSDDLFLAVISLLAFKDGGSRTMAVPVTASGAIEQLAARYKGKVIRTQANPRSIMEKAIEARIFLGRKGLPHFLPVFDALVSLGKILEMMSREGRSLSELVRQVPEFYMRQEAVNCPWEAKGRVMRRLIEDSAQQGRVELIDGVKVYHQTGWTLVLPDSEEPVVRIYSEGSSPEEADALLQACISRIEAMGLS